MKKNLHLILTLAIVIFFAPKTFAASPIVFEGDTTIAGITYHMVYNRTGEINASVKTTDSKIKTAHILSYIEREGKQYPVLTIGEYAFNNLYSLTTLIIPNTVTTIEKYGICSCTRLDSISIPSSIKTIGRGVFESVPSINKTNVESLEWLCNSPFDFSTSLVYPGWGKLYLNGQEVIDLVIPESVEHIGSYAFDGCTEIKTLDIPKSVTTIGNRAFYYCIALESINIPESITSIGEAAFGTCLELKSVYIPNSVTTLESNAFRACKKLTTATIDASTFIPDNAFSNCSNLTSITIGKSVPSVRSEAFAYCDNLEVVYCLSATPPTAYATAFAESYPEYMTLHVPAGTKHLYEAAEVWKDFGMIVEDDEVMGIDEVGNDVTEVIDYSQPYDVYNMQGVRVGATTTGLVPGLYVVRQGGAIAKIAIR